jgi:lipoyl-dependent peroxiredoxin
MPGKASGQSARCAFGHPVCFDQPDGATKPARLFNWLCGRILAAAALRGKSTLTFWRTLVQKTASAKWSGGIKDGKGYISTQTGVLKDAPYGFSSRFEGGPGTNPEELIGAAHSGCFTMALSLQLTQAGLTAESIETKSTVTLDKVGDGFSITACHLDVKAKVPGADQATFEKLANAAKEGCPVSKLFAGNAKITLNTEFVS